MANGSAPNPQTVPGTQQAVSYPSNPQQYQVEQAPPAPKPEAEAKPELPSEVQQELSQLREFREKAGNLAPLVEQLGGDTLYQHYSNYAQMIQDRNQQESNRQRGSQQDSYSYSAEADPYESSESREIRALKEQLGTAQRQISDLTRSTGLERMAQHSQRFFEQEFPDLSSQERDKINKGMRGQLETYAQSDQGRAFLQNPSYEAIRALALQHLPPNMMEEVYRRKFEREQRGRSRLATDSYRASRPAEEEVDMGEDFATTWERAGERARREVGIE